MARYDEDLHENEFFRTLVSKYTVIFNEAAEKKLLVCVPRRDTVSRLRLSQSDFENHILRPDVDNKYTSLNEKCAEINEDVITTGPGYKEVRKVKILFEECFFNPNDESYQVLCLDQPLEGVTSDDVAMVTLETPEDCYKLLWSVPGSDKAKKIIDNYLKQFTSNEPLLTIVEKMSEIYNLAVQEIWKVPSIRKVQSVSYRSSYKLAIETYIMANLHQQVFKELCFNFSPTDATLNEITRNYSDISPEFLGIKPQYRLNIEKARLILSELNQCCTPLEKLCCFKQSCKVLTTLLGTANDDVMTADDLLPILVYLVITSDIPNWNANIFYISKFHFSNVNQDEFTYYLASFEAAVEYARTEVTKNMNSSSVLSSLTRSTTAAESEESAVTLFFKYIQRNNLEEVKALLDEGGIGSVADDFCHPLCSCEKCTSIVEKRLNDTNRITVSTRDSEGQTGLHHAAKYGLRSIVHYLMERGASVTAADHHSSTPLHLACQKGHQSCVLLLLSDPTEEVLNAKDESGNIPLHLACSNGHEECAKALLFQKMPCQVDAQNIYGDTPLHNAARWGYASIVTALLEQGVSVNIINKSGETPLSCAQSRKVQDLLTKRDIPRSVSVSVSGKPGDTQKAQKRRSKALDSVAEIEKQLKKLLRAIRDNDLKLVEFMFPKSNADFPDSAARLGDDSHHPLCNCDTCIQNALINAYDGEGFTPLHHAAKQGNVKMVEFLLKHGADVGAVTKADGLVALHLACQYNHRDVAVILLHNGAEVNTCDCHGNTPLHFSCSNGHVDTTAILLYHGADVTMANDRKDTALHHAARWNQCTLVKELLLFGAQYSVLNKDNKTPLDLTKDEQVKGVIEKAMKGEIEVGSYRTTVQSTQRALEPTQADQPQIVESEEHNAENVETYSSTRK